jgi:hypothetical protein
MYRILDVDPLNRRSPSTVQENWDVPSPEPWEIEVDEPKGKEPWWDDSPHVTDPDFDWSTIGKPADTIVKPADTIVTKTED